MKKSFEEFVREYEECCEIYGERCHEPGFEAFDNMNDAFDAMYAAYPEETDEYVNTQLAELGFGWVDDRLTRLDTP